MRSRLRAPLSDDMARNEKGFFLFYDWIDDLNELDGADAWEVVKAISIYHREGTNPVELVDGPLRAIVSMMFNQIKRAEQISEARQAAGRTGGTAKAARDERLLNFAIANDSKTAFCYSNAKATEEQNTIYSHSLILSGAHVHTREEDEPVENSAPGPPVENSEEDSEDAPDGVDEEARAEALERLKRHYLGGTLGQGLVLMSSEQFDVLCEELSLAELEHYMGVITRSERSGHHYTRRTHFQAIREMAYKDRQTKGG